MRRVAPLTRHLLPGVLLSAAKWRSFLYGCEASHQLQDAYLLATLPVHQPAGLRKDSFFDSKIFYFFVFFELINKSQYTL
jgi:hypothetical protein